MIKLGIKNKTVLITGAGRGIGQDICKKFIREKAKVIAISRSSDKFLKNINLKSKKNIFLQCDLEKENSVKEISNELIKKKIYPDIIINNVGGTLNYNSPFLEINNWKKVFKLNLEISVEINNFFLPYMIKKKWGRICHVSSIAGLENQGPPAYCASKAALNAYVRSVGRYVSKDNVIMTSIMPGAIFTKDGFWDLKKKNKPKEYKDYIKNRMAIQRIGKVSEISELTLILCSNISSFCAGTNLLVDGGQGRVFQQI